MGIAGLLMKNGYDALWYPVCYATGYLFLLLFIAGPLRRFGAYTIPDFAEGRFDSPAFRKVAVTFVLFIGFFYTMPQMKGAGVTMGTILNWPYWAGIAIVGVVITFNVAFGGMKGITFVQAFQYWAKLFAISVPIFVLASVLRRLLGRTSAAQRRRDGRPARSRRSIAKAPFDGQGCRVPIPPNVLDLIAASPGSTGRRPSRSRGGRSPGKVLTCPRAGVAGWSSPIEAVIDQVFDDHRLTDGRGPPAVSRRSRARASRRSRVGELDPVPRGGTLEVGRPVQVTQAWPASRTADRSADPDRVQGADHRDPRGRSDAAQRPARPDLAPPVRPA